MLRSDRILQQIDSTMRRFECSAILFDLDGVLVDSTRQVEAQWRAWASAKGLAAEPFLEVCHGRRALETIRLAAPQLDAEAEVAAFRPEEGKDGLIGPVPGAARLLENLPVGSWAVATSGTRRMASERLRRAGLPLPNVLVCAEDVLHGKPSPEVYLLAAAGLAVDPADCIVIEDAPAGIQAARAADMRVIGLTTTHPPELLPADACTGTLTGVHLGRIDHGGQRGRALELLVVDI
jgi:mannitol-1-/sugar-/sorbitol-6-phosphatase